jgi:hypothetical protein
MRELNSEVKDDAIWFSYNLGIKKEELEKLFWGGRSLDKVTQILKNALVEKGFPEDFPTEKIRNAIVSQIEIFE